VLLFTDVIVHTGV